jgi:hypothetical protein
LHIKQLHAEPNVVFFSLIAKPRERKQKKFESDLTNLSFSVTILTIEQEVWNARIAHVRSRVESLFGLIKNK